MVIRFRYYSSDLYIYCGNGQSTLLWWENLKITETTSNLVKNVLW